MKKDWRDIFESLRIALDIRKMFLGFAILATLGIGYAIFSGFVMYQVVDDHNAKFAENLKNPGLEWENVDDLNFANRGFFELLSDGDGQALYNAYSLMLEDLGFKQYVEKYELNETMEDVFANPQMKHISDDFEIMKVPMFPHHEAQGFTFWRLVVLIIISLVVWFFVSRWAGAISRIAVVEFAKDERMEMGEALDFAKKNSKPLFWAPISLLMFFILLFLAIALWGLVGQIPWIGPIVDILTSPLVLIAGFLMALLVFGGVFSLNMYLPAVAAEATDSFDSLSRSFSYFFSKPFKTLWYYLVQFIYGVICVAFIWFITWLIFYMISWAAGYGMGENWTMFKAFITLTPYEGDSIGLAEIADKAGFFPAVFSFFMGIIAVMIGGMAISFIVSFKLTAQAITYLILRYKVDGTEMTDIHYEEIDFINALENSAKTEEKPAVEEKKEETKEEPKEEPAKDEEKPKEEEADVNSEEEKGGDESEDSEDDKSEDSEDEEESDDSESKDK